MTEYVCSNCTATHTPIEDDVDPWECVECASGLMEPRSESDVITREELRGLIEEWREEGKSKRMNPNGMMEYVGMGQAMQKCADELEAVLDNHE
jgi:DNA-directed RNA polymerase subunit RPC12/RpoP